MNEKGFKFQVILQELLDGYTSISHAIGDRQNTAILQMVLFEVADSALIMRAFNNSLQIERRLDIANDGIDVSFCIPTFMFTVLEKYSQKTSKVEFEQIEIDDKLVSRFSVSQKKRSNEFSFISSEEYPIKIEVSDYSPVDMLPLIEAFKLVAVGSADEAAKKVALRHFHLDSDGVLLAGNGTQFAKYNSLNISSDNGIILLRIKLVIEDIKLLNEIGMREDCECGHNEKWLGFRSLLGGQEIVFQLYTSEPPIDISEVFQIATKDTPICTVKVNLEELNNVLELCEIYEKQALSAAYPSYTKITINDDEMIFEIQIEDLSSNKERIDILGGEDRDEFTIQILASKLREMIIRLTGDNVTIEFYPDNGPFRVLAEGCSSFEYLQASSS